MKRKLILAGLLALLLPAGCLLASCGEEAVTESPAENASTAESSFGASAESSAKETSSEATSSETTAEVTSEEASSGTGSEETSDPPEETEPDITPLPEHLPGLDSPEPPEEVRCYLPVSGYWENTGIDSPPQTYTFTYGKDTMVIEQRNDYGGYFRSDYRFDDRGHVVEESYSYYDGSESRNLYTYDEAGRLIRWENVRQNLDERVTARHDYTYGEDGGLIREVSSVMNALGETPEYTNVYTYERSYDENGALTRLVQTRDDYAGYTETLYEDGREVLSRTYDENGEILYLSANDYDEQGRLTRVRFRSDYSAYADSYLYEGERLAEVRRYDGVHIFSTYRYAYDAYGRLQVELGNDWGTSYDVVSYDERGSLCKVMGFTPRGPGTFEEMKHEEVTAWGDEAVTEMQLAFYRVAMAQLFGDSDTLGEQFYVVKLPEP